MHPLAVPTAVRNAEIVALARDREDLTLEQIGRKWGLTRQRVKQIATKAGVERGIRNALDAQDKATILALHGRGMPMAHIASAVGRADSAVAAFLIRAGRHVPDPIMAGDKSAGGAEKRRQAVRLVKDGLSFEEAGAQVGLTRNAVAGACHRAGVRVGFDAARRANLALKMSRVKTEWWDNLSASERAAHGEAIKRGWRAAHRRRLGETA